MGYDYHQKKLNEDYKIYLENHIKKCWNNYIFMEDIQEALHKSFEIIASIEGNKKDAYVILDNYLGTFDLTESFTKKVILLNTEPYRLESLLLLHDWFSDRCCNITNIFLISDHSIGAKKWYENFLNLFNKVGFNIIETPIRNIQRLQVIGFLSKQQLQKDKIRKKLKYYFNAFMGGYTSFFEKDFLATYFSSKKEIGYVDFLAGYQTTLPEFDNYLESLTHFSDRNFVDFLISLRENGNFFNSGTTRVIPTFNNIMNSDSHKSIVKLNNQSFCQLLRETYNSVPWTCVSEKTLDCFLNCMIPIPLSGTNAVSNLENIGFKFDHNMIDYSYQSEKDFVKRILKIGDVLDRISKTHSLAELEEYILDNREILWYNYNYIVSGDLEKYLEQEFIKQL